MDFLFDAYEALVGEEPLSFLEIASGPAQHALEMAESKLEVFCVDHSKQMTKYAADLAALDDLKMGLLTTDMRTFELPVCPISSCSQPVSYTHLTLPTKRIV